MTQHARTAAGDSGGGPAVRIGRGLAGLAMGLATGLMVAVLFGCMSAPPPAAVELSVQSAADLNPDASGRPSPVVMRVYHLASKTAFETADFFQLYKDDTATLGADLLGRDEVVIRPGESRTLVRELKPGARFLGLAVFFRNFEGAEWRAVAPVPPNGATALNASLGALSVSLNPGESQP